MVEPEATSFYSSKSHHIEMFSYCLVSRRLGIDHKEIPTLLHPGIYIGKEFFSALPQLLQSLFLTLINIFFVKFLNYYFIRKLVMVVV